MNRVLFINPNSRELGVQLSSYPPLGILYISSFLLKRGYDVKFIDADVNNNTLDELSYQISDFNPNFIGITMSTLQYRYSLKTAEFIKLRFPFIKIIMGGPHPSAVREKILIHSDSVDFVIFGEGELTFTELIEAINSKKDLHSIDGLCFRDNEKIVVNPERKLIENLDELPFPAWELVGPISKYPAPYPSFANPSIHVMASRGCPFSCSFCSNPVFGKTVRMRSPESIIREIEYLFNKLGIREIFFQDDTFNINRKWFEEICHLIIEKKLHTKMVFKTPFRANSNLIDYNLLNLAKKAGFWMIFYGVESGNQRVLNSINKGLTLNEIERAFKLTRKVGIRSLAAFMIGNLDEDEKTIEDTIKFAKKINPDYFGFSIAMPYPGSKMYLEAKKRGILKKDCEFYNYNEYLINSPHFKDGEIENLAKKAIETIIKYKKSGFFKFVRYLKLDFSYQQYQLLDYCPVEKVSQLIHLNNTIIMGQNDKGSLGFGWHNLEKHENCYRWTEKKAFVFLKNEEPAHKLMIKCMSHYDNLTVNIKINQQKFKFIIKTPEWKIFHFSFDNKRINNCFKVEISVNKTWRPSKYKFYTNDQRRLGVAVEKIWIE